ncbi:MAG: hypothetical protein GXO86_06725 [Chlorobi bacterium]|nr:hypothetical protein [Chlorobiota bacterium]
MKKLFIMISLLTSLIALSAQEMMHPEKIFETAGAVTDFSIRGSRVILGTDAGSIETYNLLIKEKTGHIQLLDMLDFMGDTIPTKIFSIDKFNGKLLLVTQGNHGFRDVIVWSFNGKMKLIDADSNKMLVKKVRFVNDNQVLMGLLSNELVLFDMNKNEIIYKLQISAYAFSDFSLSEDSRFVFTSDESGIVHKIDVAEGKIVTEYSGINVDNVYQLDYKNGTIITGGRDRRVGIYQTGSGNQYYLQKDFPVYCVALNQQGTTGAFTADEENTVTFFDVQSKKELFKLVGHPGVITKMGFYNDKTFITASEDGYLMIWKLN